MTVCIASFAAKSKAIVMVSDKSVTYGGKDSIPLVSDTEAQKFLRIGETFWYTLTAGDPSFAFSVVKAAEKTLTKRPEWKVADSVEGMMQCLKLAYQKTRETAVVDTILKPRMLSKNLVVARPTTMQPITEDVFLAVTTLAKDFKPDTSLLVCGFDAKREPHIFSVVNPGKCNLHDTSGFFAVGIGATTAISRLLILEAQKVDRLELVLYQDFDAKVHAEIVEDVGYNWDAEVLIPGRPAIQVPPKIIRLIEGVYADFPQTPLVEAKNTVRVAKLTSEKRNRTRMETLTKFVDSILDKAKPHAKSGLKKSKSKQ